MSVQDEGAVKLGGVILPGIIKTLDVTGSAQMEEQTIQGSASKPKQAVGYEDVKITIELILSDSPGERVADKIARLEALYHPPGCSVPPALPIVEETCAARGVDTVIFKSLATKENTQTKQTIATLTLWEYIPVIISASAYGTGGADGSAEELVTPDLQPDASKGKASGKEGAKMSATMRRALTPGTAENERLSELRRKISADRAGAQGGAGVW